MQTRQPLSNAHRARPGIIAWMAAAEATLDQPASDGDEPVNGASLALTLAIAASQDAAYGLVFLSYMNHYLLDVLHSSPGLPGYTLALYGGTKLLVHPIAGRLIDRSSPRGVFRAAVAIQVAAALLMLFSGTLAAFLAGSCLLAVGSAALWPLTYEVVGRTQPSQAHSRVTGMLSLVGYVATTVGVAVGVLIGHFAGHRDVAFAVLLATIAFPVVLGRGPALARRGPAEPLASAHVERSWTLRRLSGVALFALVVFVDYAAITSLAGVYGPYVRITLGVTLFKAGLYLAPAGVAALIGLLLAAKLSRPGRRLQEMALLFALSAVGALGLATTVTPWIAGLFAMPLAAGAGGVGPIVAASMIEQGGGASRGTVLGALMSIEGLGAVLGPGVVAAVINFAGPSAGLVVVGATFACLVPLSFAAARHHKIGFAAPA
jgi:predicted MFS family arabinose efflux permease